MPPFRSRSALGPGSMGALERGVFVGIRFRRKEQRKEERGRKSVGVRIAIKGIYGRSKRLLYFHRHPLEKVIKSAKNG